MMTAIEGICGRMSSDPDDSAMIITMIIGLSAVLLPTLFGAFIGLALWLG